jgi:HAMP domain-containing protein
MSLEDWSRNGWIEKHESRPEEIEQFLLAADEDICDAELICLSADWRHNIAYNAALRCATAALAASGYRVRREMHQYRTIQSLPLTIGSEMHDVCACLDKARKSRAEAVYQRSGVISDAMADEILELAKRLRKQVEAWLRNNHPHLVKEN